MLGGADAPLAGGLLGLVGLGGEVEGAHAEEVAEIAAGGLLGALGVDDALADLLGLPGVALRVRLHAGFDGGTAVDGLDGVAPAAPVGVERAVEAEGGEHVIDVGAVRAPLAAHGVITAHDGPALPLLHRNLEGAGVNLAQRALGAIHVDDGARPLLVVQHPVLHAGGDLDGLEAAADRRRHLARKERVLAEILEVARAERGAGDVRPRPQKHPRRHLAHRVSPARLAPQCPADLLGQGLIPRRRVGDGRGEVGDRRLVVRARAVRAVERADLRQADAREQARAHAAAGVAQTRLLLLRQARHQVVHALLDGPRGVAIGRIRWRRALDARGGLHARDRARGHTLRQQRAREHRRQQERCRLHTISITTPPPPGKNWPTKGNRRLRGLRRIWGSATADRTARRETTEATKGDTEGHKARWGRQSQRPQRAQRGRGRARAGRRGETTKHGRGLTWAAREARAVGSGQRAKPAERPAEPASLPRLAVSPRRLGRRPKEDQRLTHLESAAEPGWIGG